MKMIKIFAAIISGIIMTFLALSVSANTNLALNKEVSFSYQQPTNEAAHAVDGSMETRWSAEGYNSYIEIDLGGEYCLGTSVIVPRAGKRYDYIIETSNGGSEYSLAVESVGKTDWIYFDNLGGVYADSVKITFTGGNNDNNWVSINEIELYAFGSKLNRALQGSVTELSDEESSKKNYAKNIIDGNKETAWAAQGYPQYVTVDLKTPRAINEIRLTPFDSRAYQYKVEASLDGKKYAEILDRTGNSVGREEYSDEISNVSARFVRLTVTGSANNNEWVNIEEFSVYGNDINVARPVDGVNITLSGNTVSMTGISSALYGGTVNLIAVVFDGNLMTEFRTAEIVLSAYGEAVGGSLELLSELDGKTVEAFVWDNDISMTSCSDTFVLN